MPAHILIADDDAISRDVLKLVLVNRGNTVTVADDGWAAAEMLGSEPFDIAILDYHMPLLDGVATARRVRELTKKQARPRFIGVTADPGGLEEREGAYGIFDAIVQKPINIPALLDVVETSLRNLRDDAALDRRLSRWQARGLERCPRVRFAATPSARMRLQLDTIFDLTKPENPDLILLTDGTIADAVGDLRTAGNLFTLPAIDMTGRMEAVADAAFRPSNPRAWGDVACRVKAFAARRLLLSRRFIGASRLEDQVLAYIFVSGRDLRPVADPAQDGAIIYPGLFPAAAIPATVESLTEQGLLTRFNQQAPAGADRPAASAACYELSDLAIERLTGAPPIAFAT